MSTSEANGRTHRYNAEATILSGDLRLPLVQKIEPQAHSQLKVEGGYLSERSKEFRIESVLSFRSGYTHVAGNRSLKPDGGWTTLTTTVIEGLNVLDVVTADRVVGQIVTDHPLEGYVPSISFLGTRFENLRIAGHLVDLDLDLTILGDKPGKDAPYTHHKPLLGRIRKQYDRIRQHKQVPKDLAEQYNRLDKTLGNVETLECSLVNQAAGGYPGLSFGHKIRIPGFGEVTLAKLTLLHEDPHPEKKVPRKTTFRLTMVEMKLGCAIDGMIAMADGGNNGGGWP